MVRFHRITALVRHGMLLLRPLRVPLPTVGRTNTYDVPTRTIFLYDVFELLAVVVLVCNIVPPPRQPAPTRPSPPPSPNFTVDHPNPNPTSPFSPSPPKYPPSLPPRTSPYYSPIHQPTHRPPTHPPACFLFFLFCFSGTQLHHPEQRHMSESNGPGGLQPQRLPCENLRGDQAKVGLGGVGWGVGRQWWCGLWWRRGRMYDRLAYAHAERISLRRVGVLGGPFFAGSGRR